MAVASCGGDAKPRATATPGTAATTGAGASATPAPEPTGGASPAASATPIDWSHRLAVYGSVARVTETGGRRIPVRNAIVWDLAAGKPVRSFEWGADNDAPVTAQLAGRKLVLATETAVTQIDIGSGARSVVFRASEGTAVQDIRVSPDGSVLAVTVAGATLAELRFIDLPTLSGRLRVEQSDARFAGMRGQFWQLQWRDDGSGVLVSTATNSEMWGSLATVFLDGRVRQEQADGYGNVSPTGRERAGLVGNVDCMLVGSHELVIRDLDSGNLRLTTRDETKIFTPWEYSPDGSEFVFLRRDGVSCDDLSGAAPEIWKEGIASAPATPGTDVLPLERVTDLKALHQKWYGASLWSADCDQSYEPVVDRWGDARVVCAGAGPDRGEVTVRLSGIDVGKAVAPVPIGIIEP
ncbi:MAG: hypothetical protein HYX53_14120 [Chloroflexi bacterium]|nr:hypothetical protein [Chloroflexota bacterium]